VTPLSVQVDREPGERPVPDELRLIYAGGFYPWQNCMEVLVAIGEELDRAGTGRLDLFGGVHEFSDSPEFQQLFARLRTFDRVHLHGFVARDELAAYYRRASAAVDLMHRNIERELAVTTRTAEYLAQGIPPLYNDYNILSDLVRRHEAGWCLDPEDLEGVRRLVRHLLDHHAEEIPRRSANAARIYAEELTVPATTADLAEACRSLGADARAGRPRRHRIPAPVRTEKPFHKRFYYAWQALRGRRLRVVRE
jgi:glycosyltransferase involved in cell wall biosynthesis